MALKQNFAWHRVTLRSTFPPDYDTTSGSASQWTAEQW